MKYGFKPSPSDLKYNSFDDVRNGILGLATGTDDSYIIPDSTPILDQGHLNSCVANSSCKALEVLLANEGQPFVPLSRLFLYWNARSFDQTTDRDEGTYIHNAFGSLQNLGVCSESEWGYDLSRVFIQPTIRAYQTANDNKITAFYRIDTSGNDRVNDIVSALKANHPVVFGTQVGDEFESYNGDANVVLNVPAKPLGGHAMCIVGFRRNPNVEFLVCNSWGSSYGINGHVWFSDSYIANESTSDLWVPTRVDTLLI